MPGVEKTWVVNSQNPRPEHVTMDGETVPINESFSNGMMFPGDPAGGPENNANCSCSMVVEGQVVTSTDEHITVPAEFASTRNYTDYDTMRNWGTPMFEKWLKATETPEFSNPAGGKIVSWNNRLRAGETIENEAFKHFDDVLETQGVLMDESVVWRGGPDLLAEAGSFKDDGFVFTSVLPQHAGSWAQAQDGVLMKIRFPNGTRAAFGDAFDHEGEFVFGRGWTFTAQGSVRTESVNYGGVFKDTKVVDVIASKQ